MSSSVHSTYATRVANFKNEAARALLETMERKQSNLCVSVDVTRKADLLAVVRAVAGFVCLVKTHIDIVEDFDADLVDQLTALSKEHDFLIFEDRKFADIGNTVTLQYSSGVHKIASWSHITNAHLVPGPGIIDGLAVVGKPLGRGLLLLAGMSSKGTLARGEYAQACVDAARADEDDFVFGFIAQHRVDEDKPSPVVQGKQRDFLVLTPGVGLDVKGDGLGQQYNTPDHVVREKGCDVIIVGRGIYGALLKPEVVSGDEAIRKAAIEEVTRQGQRYKKAGWEAYEKRLGEKTNGFVQPNETTATPLHVFGYGSLIFKPPPHTVKRTVGYIKGYVRRFAQSSIDHRGVPSRPGRVVTLVEANTWHALESTEQRESEQDVVWGVCWTIEEQHASDVRKYLDHREKNGYSPTYVSIYGVGAASEEPLLQNVLLYVGLPSNPAFVGPAKSLDRLADYIFSCEGPSGRNDEYLLRLARATRALAPEVQDAHLFGLERRLLTLRQAAGMGPLAPEVVDAEREQKILDDVLGGRATW